MIMTCDVSGGTVDAPYPTLCTAFDVLFFAALLALLILFIAFAAVIAVTVLNSPVNRAKMIDKLTQLLSEGDTSKMSLSRVQAFLFTYVITFGTLLIIARTGQFPANIPDDLAILAGGSLGTFVVSKAIQGSTNQGPTSPSARQPPASGPAGQVQD
jgi:hypothetical protein